MDKLLLLATMFLTLPADASLLKDEGRQDLKVQGRTAFVASQRTVAARSNGERNVARNSAGVIREGARIQGNTTITATQEGATAISSGRGNTAANEAGIIGGN